MGLIFFKPDIASKLYTNYLILDYYFKSTVMTIASISIFGIMTILLFSLFLRFIIGKFKVSKVSFNSASITFDKNNSSIFNKYLDEIIYFFEATKFNVVVFEDLDRFENVTIFSKLRELNRLINNSEHIKDILMNIILI